MEENDKKTVKKRKFDVKTGQIRSKQDLIWAKRWAKVKYMVVKSQNMIKTCIITKYRIKNAQNTPKYTK